MGDPFASFADTGPTPPVEEADMALAPAEDVLSPEPVVSPAGQLAGPLPDVSPLVAQTPRLPMPVMPPMPGSPLQTDPRAKLAVIAALGAALGAGPHSGAGAGILGGTLQAIQAKHAEDLKRWQFQATETQKQQLATQSQQAIMDRANEARLQQTFAKLREDVLKAPDEEAYQKIIGLYAGGLQAQGYRIQPQALMQEFRFTPQTDEQAIQEKVKAYFNAPPVKALMTQNPQMAYAGAITYKRNGQTVQMPIADALKRLGLSIPTTGPDGQPLFNPINKGPEADQAIQRANQEFVTQFGRQPKVGDAKDNDWVTQRAHQFTDKKDPVMEGIQQSIAEQNNTLRGLQIQAEQQRIAQGNATQNGVEIKDGSKEYRMAQDLAYGKLTMSQFRSLLTSRGGGTNVTALKMGIYDKARELNPQFNPASFEMGFKFASDPKTQNALVFIDNVLPQLDKIVTAAKGMNTFDAPGLNRLFNTVGFQMGGKQITDVKQLQSLLGPDIGLALGSGSLSDLRQQTGVDLANPNLSGPNFVKTIGDIQNFLAGRKTLLLRQMGTYGQPGMNPGATPDAIAPNPGRFTIVPKGGG